MGGRWRTAARAPRGRTAVAVLAAMIGCCGFLLAPSPAQAQAVTGTLLGNVTDSSGAAIPGATVTALETQTNTSRTAVTNESGNYIFSSLQNGNYTIEVELQGFKKVVRPNVQLDVNTTVRVDLKLEVGQLNETLTVSAETPLLQTDRTDTGRILESKMVAELPLTFNRNFQSLMVTVPGITRPHREHSQFFNSQDSLRFEVNGQPGMASNTLIEGLDDNQKTGLLQVIIPAADALETVSVTTSNYDAEFGRSGGAVTNVTLKSGTNDLKGTVFFFGNNNSTNASDYLTHLKAPTKFVNAGFTLGGPIVKNKLFFFGDYQRTLDNNGYVVRATVPTLKMRNGDFSEVTNGIYDPKTGAIDGSGRTAFANNQIPQDRVSSIARQLLGFIPAPNISAPFGQNNFQQAQTREKTTDGFDAKLTYTASTKDTVSYRLSFMRPEVFDPGLYGIYGGPANGGFAGTGTNTSYSGAGTWTHVFSANTLLDVRGGLNYYHNVTSTVANGLTTSADVGIPGANIDEFSSGLSQFSISGYSDPVLGFSASQPWDRSEKTWNFNGVLTKLLQSHTVKVGGEYRHNDDMLLQTQDAGGPRGRFAFNSSGTGNPIDAASTTSIANSFASFLLDWPNTVQRDLKVFDRPGTTHTGLFAFAQDKWQLRPDVTVDLGLRWEYYTPLQGLEGAGSLSNYDPATHTLHVSGFGDTDEALNVKKKFTNFAPRTGVSWRLNEKNVLRAGYGASTIPFPDNRYAFNYPVKQTFNGSATNGFQNAGSMQNGFPAPALLDIPSSGIIPVSGALTSANFDVIPNTLHEGTLHSWNVAYQRQLPYLLTADVAYVGNRGVDLVMDVDANASLIYGSGNNGRPEFSTAFARTGLSRTRTNSNKSKYNGLQMKIDRRFRNGFMLTNSYTLSRSYDYVNENGTVSTPIDFEQSWGRSNFDRLHNYTLTGLYELPWGPNKRWMKEGLAGKLIGGWQLSGLFVAQSGVPLSITGSGTVLNTPGTTPYVNLNGDNRILGGLGQGNLYFDPSVYSQPAAGVQGNMTRNSGPEGPGFWEIDGSLFKRFAITGSRYAEFRVDAYNVTNSVRWGNPNTTFSTSTGNTFGQVTGTTGGQRTLRFGARFVF